jgi:type II secretory pathway pseudopilin PulG
VRPLKSKSGRAGFTLIEVLIGCTVLAMLIGSLGAVLLSARGTYEQGLTTAALEARARRTVQRIATELTGAEASTLWPQPALQLGVATIQFRTCGGYAGGAQQWNPIERIELRPDPNDPDDGIDNDSDGSIDEQQIVLVRNFGQPDQIESVICGGVREYLQGETPNMADDNGNGLTDERGLSIVTDANGTLTIRVTLEGRDPHGFLVAQTVETAVHVRN